MGGVVDEPDDGGDQPGDEREADDPDGLACKGVSGALADENADVHGALDDDHVGEGEGEEEKDEEGGEVDPLGDVLADVGPVDEGDDNQDEEGREANGGSDVKDADAAAGVSGKHAEIGAEREEKPETAAMPMRFSVVLIL